MKSGIAAAHGEEIPVMHDDAPDLAGHEELFGDYAFGMDLERLSRPLVLPAALASLAAWIPFLLVDRHLFPGNDLVTALRLGLTVVGAGVLALLALPRVRENSHVLLLALFAYLNLSAGAILGLVGGDPVYLGGFSIILLILPMAPLGRKNSLWLIALSIALFAALGLCRGMRFDTPQRLYGLFNFAEATLIAVVAAVLLERARRDNFVAQQTIHLSNIQLQRVQLKLMEANRSLETTADELRRTNEELRQVNDLKSSILAVAAHDLKNPLQVVTGFSKLLRRRIKEDRKGIEQLEMIISASEKMVTLINELLDTVVIDTGRLQLVEEELLLGPLAESVVSLNRPLAARKGQTLVLEPGEGCRVRGDRLRLQQVMDNLVSNAVKFSPPGGVIFLRLCRENGEVRFEVHDRGPGLSEGDRERVFGRFQRLSARPTGGEHSTGLGLSIVKDLVELHRGSVEVESEPGQGAVFRVRIPALPAPAPPPPPNPE
ncbi:MAG: HAMP domain-containing histidine kinase [Acidobacteria bacterium]|nr:HAMP domain-containing histidine kinase [Acidobacteriota bacterium]